MILVLECFQALIKNMQYRQHPDSLILKKIVLFVFCIMPLCLLSQIVKIDSNSAPTQNDKNISKSKADTAILKDLEEIIVAKFHIKPKKLPKNGKKKVYFSLIPVSSTVPRGSQASLSSTNGAFYLGERKYTSISNITFSPYPSFDGRFTVPFSTNIWLNKNTWKIVGETRFLISPQDSWGLGGNTPQNHRVYVHYNYLRLNQTVFKKIAPDFFVGVGYNLDDHFHIRTANDTLRKFTNYDYGTGRNSFSLGLTFNLLYDSRDNSINPLSGWLANFIYRNNSFLPGSNTDFQSVYIDVRKYIPFSLKQQNVLAFWSYYWTILGGNPPYLDLPSIGWDMNTNSGRGFEQNRYRGKGLFYLESEYRHDLTNNGLLGYVLFANLHSVTEYPGGQFSYWHPAAGLGLRIKLDKISRTNICIDYAFSKSHNGIYLNLGERF
jgi:hypothetical protein